MTDPAAIPAADLVLAADGVNSTLRAKFADAFQPSIEPSALRRRAVVSLRVLRSVSAWALPRPSATASAKLA